MTILMNVAWRVGLESRSGRGRECDSRVGPSSLSFVGRHNSMATNAAKFLCYYLTSCSKRAQLPGREELPPQASR